MCASAAGAGWHHVHAVYAVYVCVGGLFGCLRPETNPAEAGVQREHFCGGGYRLAHERLPFRGQRWPVGLSGAAEPAVTERLPDTVSSEASGG